MNTGNNEMIASRLHEFFGLIDNGSFYIACVMGRIAWMSDNKQQIILL